MANETLPPWSVAMERDRSRALFAMLEDVAKARTLEEAQAIAARRLGYGPVPELLDCEQSR